VLLGCVGGMVCTDVGGTLVVGIVVAGDAVGDIVVGGTGGSKVNEVYMIKRLLRKSWSKIKLRDN